MYQHVGADCGKAKQLGGWGLSSVSVEAQTDSLQHPVGDVLRGEQVRLKHQPHPHCIPPQRGGVHWCPNRILRYKIHMTVRTKHWKSKFSSVWRPVVPVVHTCNLRWWASMGMTLRMGSSTTRTFGLLFTRQPFSISQSAPSRYRPDTKQPAGDNTISTYN